MNKNTIIGVVVGTVVLYALGYVIWVMLFADFFEANAGAATNVSREMPIIWAQIVGSALYAIALTLAIQGTPGTVMDGLKTGALVGILIWGTADFTLYGITQMNTLTAAIADTILEGVRGGIVGAIIAITLSKLKA
jgi:hypothetical protein